LKTPQLSSRSGSNNVTLDASLVRDFATCIYGHKQIDQAKEADKRCGQSHDEHGPVR